MMVACDHHAHAPAYCVHVGDVASHPHEPCVDDCTGEWRVSDLLENWFIRHVVHTTGHTASLPAQAHIKPRSERLIPIGQVMH